MEREPWKHQADVIPLAVRSKVYALLWDMGVGKTYTSIQIMRHWFSGEKRVLRTLVFGPGIVVENWCREIRSFSKFGNAVTPLVGTGKARLKTFQKRASQGQVFVMNYHSLLNKELLEELIKWAPECIVFDEIHRLKDSRAKMSLAAAKLAKLASYKLGLTGTLVLNSAMDIFHPIYLLDDGRALGKSAFTFKRTYFRDLNAGMPKQRYFPNWALIPGKLKEIESKISHIASVVKKDECLSLPPLVRQARYIDLSSDQAKAYKEMEKDFISFVGTKACTADLAITRALRLQQIVSGYMPAFDDEETVDHEFKDNPRITALGEILEDIGSEDKTIIWAVYHQNFKAIRRLLEARKIRYVELHGKVSAAEKQKALDDFANIGGIKVLLGHPASGGVGCNMVAAKYSIFYSRTFSLEQSLQAEARNHRGGSEIHSSITRIDLVAKGTIEESVVAALLDKKNVLESVLQGIKDVGKSK